MQRIFPDHNDVKLEINNKRKMKQKIPSMWKLSTILLKNHWIKREIRKLS